MSPISDSMSHNSQIYALAIIAHPDDESFLFAGTTKKFEEEGKKVAVICATRGEHGTDRLNRNLSEKKMSEIRTSELLKACNILHCDCKKFFNHKDGFLADLNFNRLVEELVNEINLYQPQIILTFGKEGVSGHKDHIAIGQAAKEASKIASPKPSEIWCACVPSSLSESFSEHMNKQRVHHSHFAKTKLDGVADEKITKIDISKYKATKLEALKAHKSQYVPHLIWPFFLEFEYFEVIKVP